MRRFILDHLLGIAIVAWLVLMAAVHIGLNVLAATVTLPDNVWLCILAVAALLCSWQFYREWKARQPQILPPPAEAESGDPRS
jgi:membrane protein implicated in regulation of membrane protease activity